MERGRGGFWGIMICEDGQCSGRWQKSNDCAMIHHEMTSITDYLNKQERCLRLHSSAHTRSMVKAPILMITTTTTEKTTTATTMTTIRPNVHDNVTMMGRQQRRRAVRVGDEFGKGIGLNDENDNEDNDHVSTSPRETTTLCDNIDK